MTALVVLQIFQPMTAQFGHDNFYPVSLLVERYVEGHNFCHAVDRQSDEMPKETKWFWFK